MKIDIIELYKADPVKACRLALRRTVKICETERLESINKLLGGFGTEAIRGEWQNGYWCDIVCAYVNKGHTYATTVLDVRDDWGGHRFIVSSWGDWVERNGERMGVQ